RELSGRSFPLLREVRIPGADGGVDGGNICLMWKSGAPTSRENRRRLRSTTKDGSVISGAAKNVPRFAVSRHFVFPYIERRPNDSFGCASNRLIRSDFRTPRRFSSEPPWGWCLFSYSCAEHISTTTRTA